jgi:hypothetical protein
MEKVGLKGMALGRHEQNKGRDAGAQASVWVPQQANAA